MAIETELKLRLPAGGAAALLCHPLLAQQAPHKQRLLNTYYDTPDLDLLRRRIALRHRRKGWNWLITVKSAEAASGGLARRSEWEAPSQPGQFDFSHVDVPELRAWLEKRRPLLEPAFTTDFTRLAWILEPQPGTRIEVALDRGTIQSRGKKEALGELELELLAGEEQALFALALELANALGEKQALHPVSASKAERGYALFTGRQSPPLKARPAPLSTELAPLGAFRQAALDCLAHLQANEAGALKGEDPEYLHQARVAIRRLRSLFKLFAPVLPADFRNRWNPAWRELAAHLGPARNWDVLLNETLPPLAAAFSDHPAVRRLERQALQGQRTSRRDARRALAAPTYSHLLLQFCAELFALPAPPEKATTLTDFAAQRLARRARQARKQATALAEMDAAGRHQLRIAFKKLRYALEFLAPPGGGKAQGRYLGALARLQAVLGQFNDLVTAHQLITPPPTPGVVEGWLAGRAALLLEELPPLLSTFHACPPPWKRVGSKPSK
ncbi:MAG: CHAD domain-containing protein [Betaproteobacteria bacterium]|nr:CHAD domain-containing protein [Betaproteobacteria bacterium]